MKEEKRYNPIDGFEFSVLDDPNFLEDSVREELIFPIIKALGYSYNGDNKIIRSKKLLHPFVSIGSQQKKIYIIPDYVLEVNNSPSWILEAKAPNVNILRSEYNEQAYSYAIHPEVRAKYYALSNGREFVLFSIEEYKPILHFDLRLLSNYWGELKSILSPETLLKNIKRKLAKDFGLHLKRLGFTAKDKFFFPDVPVDFMQKIGNDLFTIATGIKEGDETYCVSFDFNLNVMKQFKNSIPKEVYETLIKPLEPGTGINMQFADTRYRMGVKCSIGNNLQENEDEIFLPLTLEQIL